MDIRQKWPPQDHFCRGAIFVKTTYWRLVERRNSLDYSNKEIPTIISSCTVSFASDIKLEPNIERRNPLDELQMRSKKIRLDQTGILSSIRQLSILEQISIVRYVALLLYIVAMEETGFKDIANIAWKIYTNEIFQSTTTIVSPEKSTFLAYHPKLGKEKWRELRYYLQSEGLLLATWKKNQRIQKLNHS